MESKILRDRQTISYKKFIFKLKLSVSFLYCTFLNVVILVFWQVKIVYKYLYIVEIAKMYIYIVNYSRYANVLLINDKEKGFPPYLSLSPSFPLCLVQALKHRIGAFRLNLKL